MTNCNCAFASSQVCKFTKFTNEKLIIINFQHNKLQVCIWKFAHLQVCKFENFQNF